MRSTNAVLAVAVGCLAIASSAQAQSICENLTKIMMRQSEQPTMRQATTMKGPDGKEIKIEAITLKDAMYLNDGTAWRKMAIGVMQRRSMAERAIKTMPPADCKGPANETLNGTAMQVYTYSQPNPMKPGTSTVSKLWVAVSDGLPRRLESDNDVTQALEYGEFKPPIP